MAVESREGLPAPPGRRRRVRRVAHEHREVALGPRDARVQARLREPGELLVHPARHVVDPVDRGDHVGRIVGHDDVAEDEPPTGLQHPRDPPEEVCLARTVEVVDRQGADHEPERARGQGILEPRDPEVRLRQGAPGVGEHGLRGVDPDPLGPRHPRGHPLRGLPGPRSQLEHAAGGPDRVGDGLLQAPVGGHLLGHQLEVGVRIEVELGHAPILPDPGGKR